MARFVVIRPHEEKRPPEVIQLKSEQVSYLVVEEFQRKLSDAGYQTGVTWQLVEGDVITALVAVSRL